MRVITDAKTKHFKQKAACSFIHELKKKTFKDILFKEKTKQRVTESDSGIMLSGEESPN